MFTFGRILEFGKPHVKLCQISNLNDLTQDVSNVISPYSHVYCTTTYASQRIIKKKAGSSGGYVLVKNRYHCRIKKKHKYVDPMRNDFPVEEAAF